MLFPSPAFGVREFASAVEAGYLCPQCREARLEQDEADQHTVFCPGCGGKYRQGWRRHVWSDEVPKSLRGTPIGNLGGFFQTIQHYPVRPVLPEPGEERLPHLADFVLDLDRTELSVAQKDAETLYRYLDALAPGQVRLYYSGGKGFHLVVPWQAVGAIPGPDLVQREYRFLAARLHRETGVAPDYKIYSPDRMFRLPDSWHAKTGRYKVEITLDELWECELLALAPRGVINTTPPSLSRGLYELYSQARESASEIQERFDGTPVMDSKSVLGGEDPYCIKYLKVRGLPYQGTRHQVYMMLARYWRSAGVPLEERSAYGKVTGGALVNAREFAAKPDANTDTPQSLRIRDAEQAVRYVYGQDWKFSCSGPKEIGICSADCPIRSVGAHPLAHLLGLQA